MSNEQAGRPCSPPPPYDINDPLYCRTRLSHSPPSSPIASEVVYRSPFRSRIKTARSRSPKRQKLLPATGKSLLVLELFVFLTAYTTLSEEQIISVVERVFEYVDWEGCADMDEGKGDGLGDLYDLHDRNDGGPGEVCRWILDLSEAHVTTAFGDLVKRIAEGGWGVDGIIIPPAVETGAEAQDNPHTESTWFNWTVPYDCIGSVEPITHQPVPELGFSQVPLYDRDPMEHHKAVERSERIEDYLEQARLEKKEEIRAHVDACEEREYEARERYWRLMGERASLALAGECDMTSSIFSDLASAVSTADLGSIRSSNSGIALSKTQVDDRAFNCTSNNANSKPPVLEPFPPLRRSESPKRKAAEAGLGDQWESDDVPTDAEEEERMMQHALQASMSVSATEATSPSIGSTVHWENTKDKYSNEIPWLNSRFRGSIFYNHFQSEPLIVRQAMVDGSGSEPPPPPKNNKMPGDRMMEDVDMMTEEVNQVRDASKKLGDSEMSNQGIGTEAVDKDKDQGPAQRIPDRRSRNMKGIFRDMRAMSAELNRTYPSQTQGHDKVVTDTVEGMEPSDIGTDGPAEPVTQTVNDIVRNSTDEARDIVSLHSDADVANTEDERDSCQRLAEAIEEEAAAVRLEYYRAQPPEPENHPNISTSPDTVAAVTLHGIQIGVTRPPKYRNEALEISSKNQSLPQETDGVAVVDFANFAENKAAYQKAKAAEEEEPGTRQGRDPDLKDYKAGAPAMQRELEERLRVEKRESDERRRREQSEGGRVPRPPVPSLIPPNTGLPAGPCQPPVRRSSRIPVRGSTATCDSLAPGPSTTCGSPTSGPNTTCGTPAPIQNTTRGSSAPGPSTTRGSPAPIRNTTRGSPAPGRNTPRGSPAPGRNTTRGSPAPRGNTTRGSSTPWRNTTRGSPAPGRNTTRGTPAPGATANVGATLNPGATSNPGATGNTRATADPGATTNPGVTGNTGGTANPGATGNPGATANPGGSVTLGNPTETFDVEEDSDRETGKKKWCC